MNEFAPGLFVIGGRYAAALHIRNYTLVAKSGLFSDVVSSPARPGEIIDAYTRPV